jgi:hypothetical protein
LTAEPLVEPTLLIASVTFVIEAVKPVMPTSETLPVAFSAKALRKPSVVMSALPTSGRTRPIARFTPVSERPIESAVGAPFASTPPTPKNAVALVMPNERTFAAPLWPLARVIVCGAPWLIVNAPWT